LTAILESFIVGSATSVRIANEVTATNLAKQYMADLNYCSEGGSVANTAGNAVGVCSNFNPSPPNNNTATIWTTGTISGYIFSPQVQQINNECFYTTFYPTQHITLTDPAKKGFNSGDVTINSSAVSSYAILAVVKTEWFNNSVYGGKCPSSFNPLAGANYPSVTLTMIFTDYNTGS